MTLILSTVLVSIVSALVPVVNIEVYLGVLATQINPASAIPVAASAGVGQTLGKLVWYAIAAQSMDSRWIRKKLAQEKWRRRYETWHHRLGERPALGGSVLLASSLIGLPPLLIMAVVAGSLRISMWVFVPTIVIGRAARFYLVLMGVDFALG